MTSTVYFREAVNPQRLQDILSDIEARNVSSFKKIMDGLCTNGFGLTVTNAHATNYAMILRDPSEPGRFRYQLFDGAGFSTHGTRDSVEDVVRALVSMGFRTIAEPTTLDRLSATKKWEIGMVRVDVIRRVTNGQISWHEGVRLVQEAIELVNETSHEGS